MNLNFASGLEVNLQGRRIAGFDPRGSEEDIQTRDITTWNSTSFLGAIEFLGPNVGARLRTLYEDLHFTNNDQALVRDRTRSQADATLFASLTPSTSALLGVQLATTDYDQNKQLDNFSYGVFTGFRLAPSRLLSGELNLGYMVMNFDRAPVEQPPGSRLSAGGEESLKFIFMNGAFHWVPTSRQRFDLRLLRRVQQLAALGVGTFIMTGVSIAGSQAFTERIGVRGAFDFQDIDFDSGRRDQRFRWRMGLQYRAVKWVGIRLDYIFEKRNSTDDIFEYYGNTVALSIEGML